MRTGAIPADPNHIAQRIEDALAPHGNADRAEFFSGGYAPSGLRSLGVPVPALRAIVRQFARELKPAPPRAVVNVALALTKRGTLEGRQVGYELVARRPDAMVLITPRLVARLGRGNDNWASVDGFSVFLAGPAWREGRVKDADVLGWARSRDRWWRRTALASTVAQNVAARGGHGDARRTLMICVCVAGERDPMIAKALSWALRSLVPHDPAAVRAFLRRHAKVLPSLVRREVSTKLETGRKSVSASRVPRP